MKSNVKTDKPSIFYRISQLGYREKGTALIFVLPFIIGFIIFNVIPMVYSVVISLMDFNTFKPLSMIKFIGIDNYTRLFNDPIALNAFVKSFIYTVFYVPGLIILSFVMATLLNKTFALRGLTRTLILMPYVANVVAVSIVWSILLDPFGGPINQIIEKLGGTPPMWLSGVKTALPTIAGINVWQSLAFQTIVFLAALQGVNKELYEAADMDGASRFRRLWSITLPAISPTTFFLVITSIIGSFQNYASVRMLTNGGPGTSSRVISLNIYEEAFTLNHYSYASAQAMILFAIVLVITIIQWKGQKRWVHY